MTVYPVEGIQRVVKIVAKHSGSGHVYLPKAWVGEEVEIIRTGRKVRE